MLPEILLTFLLLIISSYFVLLKILKNYVAEKKQRNITSLGIAVFISPILFIIISFIYLSWFLYEPEREFDRKRWVSDPALRYEMKEDIVDNRLLEGKSKKQIIELIGRPDNSDSLNVWNYDLGSSSAGLGWQYNYLQLIFEMEKVKEVNNGSVMD